MSVPLSYKRAWLQGEVNEVDTTQCTVTGLPSGRYSLRAMLADGRAIYSSHTTVNASFRIDSVSPQQVSLAGGTQLTIQGA